MHAGSNPVRGAKINMKLQYMIGTIISAAHSLFKVQLVSSDPDNPGMIVTCTIGGRLRKHRINLTSGDRVKAKISPYDLSRGIITYRL